jgi:hypothetical protein
MGGGLLALPPIAQAQIGAQPGPGGDDTTTLDLPDQAASASELEQVTAIPPESDKELKELEDDSYNRGPTEELYRNQKDLENARFHVIVLDQPPQFSTGDLVVHAPRP